MTRKPADQFGTTTVRPPDFDDFWAAIMAEANAIQLNPTMELVPMRSTAEVDVYDIGYDSLDGLRIAGWYCRPKDSYLPPPYPALLIVPGYISEPTLPKSWARMGYAAMGVAPRGKLRSNHHYNPGYPGLLVDNIVDRHTYAFEDVVWSEARKQKIGLVAMKVYGGGITACKMPEELRQASFRFAQSVSGVALTVIGMGTEKELEQNVQWAKEFKPMTPEEMTELKKKTAEIAKEWGAHLDKLDPKGEKTRPLINT